MKRFLGLSFASLLLVISGSAIVFATSFSEGYQSSEGLSVGTIVSVSKDNPQLIEPSTSEGDSRLTGIVVNPPNAIIDLQPKGTNIRVAISGESQVLVATTAGTIKKGDHLVVSPLAGVAERDNADSKASKYIGIAGSDFSDNSGARTSTVKLANGGQKTVALGLIDANILISDRQPGGNQQAANVLSRVGEYLTGRQVSSIRVIASAVVMVSVFTVTGWLLNGSIKGSFVSLGRNPLARLSIMSNLLKVITLALVVFAAGLTASYLVLAL